MRAILINPFDRTITEVDASPGLQDLYKLLSGPGFPTEDPFPTDPKEWADDLVRTNMRVSLVDLVRLGGKQDLWIDDDGRCKDDQAAFRMGGELTVAGRAAIFSCDDDGDRIGTSLPLQAVIDQVEWLPWNTDLTPSAPIVVGFSDWEIASKFL